MGLMITKLAKRIAALMDTMQDARILLVGLDGAGKTTLLYKFKIGEAGLPTSFQHCYFKHARSCLPLIIICAKAKLLVSSVRIIHVLIRIRKWHCSGNNTDNRVQYGGSAIQEYPL